MIQLVIGVGIGYLARPTIEKLIAGRQMQRRFGPGGQRRLKGGRKPLVAKKPMADPWYPDVPYWQQPALTSYHV